MGRCKGKRETTCHVPAPFQAGDEGIYSENDRNERGESASTAVFSVPTLARRWKEHSTHPRLTLSFPVAAATERLKRNSTINYPLVLTTSQGPALVYRYDKQAMGYYSPMKAQEQPREPCTRTPPELSDDPTTPTTPNDKLHKAAVQS